MKLCVALILLLSVSYSHQDVANCNTRDTAVSGKNCLDTGATPTTCQAAVTCNTAGSKTCKVSPRRLLVASDLQLDASVARKPCTSAPAWRSLRTARV